MAIRGPEVLLYEKNPEKHYAIMTINREERGNSISFDLSERMAECWNDARWDDDIWCVIFTGKGERFFCSGEDLKDRADLDATYPGGFMQASRDRQRRSGGGGFSAGPGDFWKPTIAAINGYSLAGGWAMAQRCDVRIAADHAMFGVPEVRWNLPASFMAQAARMIPIGIVLELTMWGARQHTAQRMYEVGWVNKVVPKERLLDEAIQWAEEVCEMGPASVWAHKELIYRANFYDNEIVSAFGRQIFIPVQRMEDAIEGPKAFAEKRKPQWKLR